MMIVILIKDIEVQVLKIKRNKCAGIDSFLTAINDAAEHRGSGMMTYDPCLRPGLSGRDPTPSPWL